MHAVHKLHSCNCLHPEKEVVFQIQEAKEITGQVLLGLVPLGAVSFSAGQLCFEHQVRGSMNKTEEHASASPD